MLAHLPSAQHCSVATMKWAQNIVQRCDGRVCRATRKRPRPTPAQVKAFIGIVLCEKLTA